MKKSTYEKPDLHMHSVYSDGTDTPRTLLRCVRKAGLDLFALTDHDTAEGCAAVRALLREGELSERHARALLRLTDEEEQLAAAKTIIARRMNVAQTEEYIESLLREIQATPPRRRPTFILKDVRLFLNSLDRSLTIMRSAGVNASCARQDTEDEILLTIRIPKARQAG